MKLLFNLIIFKSHKFFFYNSEMTHGYSTLCVEGNWEEEERGGHEAAQDSPLLICMSRSSAQLHNWKGCNTNYRFLIADYTQVALPFYNDDEEESIREGPDTQLLTRGRPWIACYIVRCWPVVPAEACPSIYFTWKNMKLLFFLYFFWYIISLFFYIYWMNACRPGRRLGRVTHHDMEGGWMDESAERMRGGRCSAFSSTEVESQTINTLLDPCCLGNLAAVPPPLYLLAPSL